MGDLEGILEGLSDSKHVVHSLIAELLPSSRLVNSSDTDTWHLLRQTALILQSLNKVCGYTCTVHDQFAICEL